nr:thioredoxin domain-containing protein [Bacillus velezensis]
MPNNSKPNSLITEKSPYLLQHAHNPVNWHPWGEEAFEKAKRENKPVLVSIGYSTCHWCHVMAHESFEDEEIARILNDKFIAIKVDREERPDVDSVYMRICQLMTGQGGWPLNVFVTPDQKPFYAGTYFPKTSKYNRPGFIDVLEHLSETFANDRQHVEDIAENAAAHLEVKVHRLRACLANRRFMTRIASWPAGLIRCTAGSARLRNFRCRICSCFCFATTAIRARNRLWPA